MSPSYRLRLRLTAHDPDKLAIVDYTKITPRPTPTPRSVTVPQKWAPAEASARMARRCHVGLGPRLIETISSSADGPLNDALQLIYFCRNHPIA